MEVLTIILTIVLMIISIGIYKFGLYDYLFKSGEENEYIKRKKVKLYSLIFMSLAFLGVIVIIFADKYEALNEMYLVLFALVLIFSFNTNQNNKERSDKVLCVIVLIFTIGLVAFGFKQSDIVIYGDNVKITGQCGSTLKKTSIINIELINEMPKIKSKVKGNSIMDIKKGKFKLEDNEIVNLYLESKDGPYLKITTDNNTYYINYKDDSETKKSFENLKSILN